MLPATGPDDRIAAGTGHRTKNLPPTAIGWAKEQTYISAIWLAGADPAVTIGLSGLAEGFDLWWADAVVRAGMRLWVAIPFEEQASRWSVTDQREWRRLRGLAEHEVVVGSLRGLEGPARDAAVRQLLAARNQLMVHRADFLVCCWRPDRTERCGTFQAICMAHRRRVPLPGVHIDPLHREINNVLPEIPDPGQPAARKATR